MVCLMKTYLILVINILPLAILLIFGNSFANVQPLIDEAFESNRDISMAELDELFKTAEIDIQSALPDPVFMTEFRGMPIDPIDPAETNEWMYMVQQMSPFPGKLGRKKEIGALQLDRQIWQTRAVQLALRARVKKIYYNLAFTQKALDMNDQIINLLQQVLQVSEAKYRVGSASQGDVYRAQIEIARLEAERVELQRFFDTRVAALNRVIGRSLDTPPPVFEMPDSLFTMNRTVASLDTLLIQNNPMLKSAFMNLRQKDKELSLARLTRYPDVTVMGGYMAMNDMPDRLMGRLSVTLPFMPWSRKDSKAQIQKASAAKSKQEIAYTDLLEKLRYKVIETVNSIQSIQTRYEIFGKTIIPVQNLSIKVSIADYKTGTVDFLTVLTNIRELFDDQLKAERLKADYYQKLSELETYSAVEFNDHF